MFYIYLKYRTGPDKEKAPNKYLLNNSFYVQNDPKSKYLYFGDEEIDGSLETSGKQCNIISIL